MTLGAFQQAGGYDGRRRAVRQPARHDRAGHPPREARRARAGGGGRVSGRLPGLARRGLDDRAPGHARRVPAPDAPLGRGPVRRREHRRDRLGRRPRGVGHGPGRRQRRGPRHALGHGRRCGRVRGGARGLRREARGRGPLGVDPHPGAGSRRRDQRRTTRTRWARSRTSSAWRARRGSRPPRAATSTRARRSPAARARSRASPASHGRARAAWPTVPARPDPRRARRGRTRGTASRARSRRP